MHNWCKSMWETEVSHWFWHERVYWPRDYKIGQALLDASSNSRTVIVVLVLYKDTHNLRSIRHASK